MTFAPSLVPSRRPGLDPGEADERRRRALRRMKLLATGLFLVATLIFAVTVNQDGALGFVNAGAEAAMVGALADWFAVTALFRHPLGLPIPHTALIPTRKDQLGQSLEEFVTTNFLSEDVVRDKIQRAEVSRRVGIWLNDPAHAERVATELTAAGRGAIAVLRDDDVAAVLEQVVLPRAAALPWSQVIGGLLDGVVDDGTHHRLIDLVLVEVNEWLEANRDKVMSLVYEQAPGWTPQWVDTRIARRVHEELHRWLLEVIADPRHPARIALDDLLHQFGNDLRNDPNTQERVAAIRDRLLTHPEMRRASVAIWTTVRRLLLETIEDPDGELRRRIVTGLTDFGRQMTVDPTLQARLDGYVEDLLGHVVHNYADEVVTVISDTIQRWDADDASRRIELHVGRDLQFIRINGTVVGALAGLAIHTVVVLTQ